MDIRNYRAANERALTSAIHSGERIPLSLSVAAVAKLSSSSFVLVTALFDCLIRMQRASSSAEMDEIRSLFAQIPHSKESQAWQTGNMRI